MTQQIITTPSIPIENQIFFLNFNNPNFTPVSNTSYVLKNTNNINVSNTFNNPVGGIYNSNSIPFIESCSYLVKDSKGDYYFTNNQNFFTYNGYYYVYKLVINANLSPSSPFIYINDPILKNSNPIGLAIDNNDFIYVALQIGNKIRRYNPNGEASSGTDFISGGSLNGPAGMVFDFSGNLYIVNRNGNGNGNVLKYNSNGTYVATISSSDFLDPCAIGINSLGQLFVSNVTNGKIFKIVLPSMTVTQIADTDILGPTGRQSVNMTFDINNNIILPNFQYPTIYIVTYNTWTYITKSINVDGYRIGGINTNKYGDIIFVETNDGLNTLRGVLLFSTYWFNNVNLPAGYNTLILFNLTTNSIVTEFTIFVEGAEPEPTPGTICFKEGTKILCKLNNQDVYISVENIEEGTLVKTYKNGYKKCKFNMRELLHNTINHNINNLFRQSKLTNSNLFEDLYITGSHSILYNKLSEKEEDAMYKLLETYNSKFDIKISNMIEDKYKLISYYDKTFTEVKKDINIYIYHLVLESDNKNRNYGIWANGTLTESIDEFTLINHANNSNIKLVNVAKKNNKILNNVFLNKGSTNIKIENKTLGTKHMNKLTKFK